MIASSYNYVVIIMKHKDEGDNYETLGITEDLPLYDVEWAYLHG